MATTLLPSKAKHCLSGADAAPRGLRFWLCTLEKVAVPGRTGGKGDAGWRWRCAPGSYFSPKLEEGDSEGGDAPEVAECVVRSQKG